MHFTFLKIKNAVCTKYDTKLHYMHDITPNPNERKDTPWRERVPLPRGKRACPQNNISEATDALAVLRAMGNAS